MILHRIWGRVAAHVPVMGDPAEAIEDRPEALGERDVDVLDVPLSTYIDELEWRLDAR